MSARKWIEYWVSELDAYGDIIDYTAQTDGAEDRGGVQARAVFDADFSDARAVRKSLERVVSYADRYENGVGDREYTTIAERQR